MKKTQRGPKCDIRVETQGGIGILWTRDALIGVAQSAMNLKTSAAGTRAAIQPQWVPAMTSRGRSLPTVTSVIGGISRDVPVLNQGERSTPPPVIEKERSSSVKMCTKPFKGLVYSAASSNGSVTTTRSLEKSIVIRMTSPTRVFEAINMLEKP